MQVAQTLPLQPLSVRLLMHDPAPRGYPRGVVVLWNERPPFALEEGRDFVVRAECRARLPGRGFPRGEGPVWKG